MTDDTPYTPNPGIRITPQAMFLVGIENDDVEKVGILRIQGIPNARGASFQADIASADLYVPPGDGHQGPVDIPLGYLPMDQVQALVLDWAIKAFCYDNDTEVSPEIRALRVVEEAVELYQAVVEHNPAGMALTAARLRAKSLVDAVFDRPPGEVEQEAGGLMVTLMALCERSQLSLHAAMVKEVERVLSKPIDHFRKRQQEKKAAGF